MKNFIHLVLLTAVLSLTAHAAVINFDSHPTDGSVVIDEAGFQFTFSASGWGIFAPGSGACCDLNYNGGPSLFANGNRSGSPAQVVMTQIGGGTFDISSFDAAVYGLVTPGMIEVIGEFSGGGSVSTTLDLVTSWQSFSLPSFQNLVSLTIRDTFSGAFLSTPGFGIDNINTGASSTVPEPATWMMIAPLVAAVAAYRRSRA